MRKIPFIIFLLILFSCSEKYSDDSFLNQSPHTYNWLMENGWVSFQESDFTQAIEYFQMAANRDATKAEPYLGLGWSYARSSDLDLESAVSNLGRAIQFSLFQPDLEFLYTNEANAGLAVVSFSNGDYESTVSYIDMVLTADPEFSFRYDNSISNISLEQLKYYSQFYMQNISELYEELINSGYVFSTVQQITAQASVTKLDNTDLDGIHLGTLQEPYTDSNANCNFDPAESFSDYGVDGCANNFENGAGGCYTEPDTNYVSGDPNGDDYDEIANPTGFDGNGIYDTGENYNDTNGNGTWDDAEEFTDVNGDGDWTGINSGYKLLYSSTMLQSCELDVDYDILDIDEGLNTFTFQGNPVILTYTYTTNYGLFINELLGLLANQ
ncbi:MAG: tetratricopeptide repeat protein [Fidelibacterota bacterium]